MPLFQWFRRAPQPAERAESDASRRWAWLGGRRVLRTSPYVFPKDIAEGGRLDLQHHLLKVAVGKNYRAPLRQPRSILDVGCGTGIWCREMALEFKQARVVGFDVDRTPMEASLARLGPAGQFPQNFEFLEADALKPWRLSSSARFGRGQCWALWQRARWSVLGCARRWRARNTRLMSSLVWLRMN